MITDVGTSPMVGPTDPCARFGGWLGTKLTALTSDPDEMASGGRWAVLATYEGEVTCARFQHWEPAPAESVGQSWVGPPDSAWRTSLSQSDYISAVATIKQRISRGDVYQANLCRVLSAQLPDSSRSNLGGLHVLLSAHNQAPYEGFLRIPGLELATASPELFLARDDAVVRTAPIKGTGRVEEDLLPKDEAENVMIVDLMRNDLSRICRPGTVGVDRLLAVEQHPGLVHLVSEIRGELQHDTSWSRILSSLLPPGSVSGAPKSSAVAILSELEPVPRGPYCGVIGLVDTDAKQARLAVGIRTFWRSGDGPLQFGTGAGITWGSDAEREWQETELKAARLVAVASRQFSGPKPLR